jgi:hypothetical protein
MAVSRQWSAVTLPKSYFGDKLGIVRERGEAVELLKNSQIELGGFDILEAAEVFDSAGQTAE